MESGKSSSADAFVLLRGDPSLGHTSCEPHPLRTPKHDPRELRPATFLRQRTNTRCPSVGPRSAHPPTRPRPFHVPDRPRSTPRGSITSRFDGSRWEVEVRRRLAVHRRVVDGSDVPTAEHRSEERVAARILASDGGEILDLGRGSCGRGTVPWLRKETLAGRTGTENAQTRRTEARRRRERRESFREDWEPRCRRARRDAYERGKGQSDGLQHRGHHGAQGSVLRALPPAGHRQHRRYR